MEETPSKRTKERATAQALVSQLERAWKSLFDSFGRGAGTEEVKVTESYGPH